MANAPEVTRRKLRNGEANKLADIDRPGHDWYRFVLSFPPHLVREYLTRFGAEPGQTVLDPFCGTGTTLVECKKLGISSIGVEANPLAHFASQIKTDWSVSASGLLRHAEEVAQATLAILAKQSISDEPMANAKPARGTLRGLSAEQNKLLLARSISPLPLHKTLVLLEQLDKASPSRFTNHERLALAKALVYSISNLHFGPEVGVSPPKPDALVVGAWMREVRTMAEDLKLLRAQRQTPATVHHADSRGVARVVPASSVDMVITSPPYPNEKDYTRTTRLESVLLGFIRSKEELRAFKQGLVRSNTRNVYKGDDDHLAVEHHREIQQIAQDIERRRLELGKTSGFERLYHKVAKLYFGGMARHLAELRKVLRPGARLAYVVGDQASFLRVMIRTGQLLGEIAQELGYELEAIDLFRTRLATATRAQLREEVVVLRWPG